MSFDHLIFQYYIFKFKPGRSKATMTFRIFDKEKLGAQLGSAAGFPKNYSALDYKMTTKF